MNKTQLWCGIPLILLALLPKTARADIANRNLLPFGDVELLTANAGVAGGPSTGAIFYNPAGLAQIEHPRVSVSGSTYVATSYDTPKLIRIDGTDLPYQQSGFDTVPSTLISTFRAGDWTLSYFLLVPEATKLSNKFTLTTPNTKSTVIQSQDSQEMWAGIALGRSVSQKTALGLSMHLIKRTQLSTAGVIFNFPNATDTGTVSNTHEELTALGLGFTLGTLTQVSDLLTLGFRLQTPLIPVGGSGKAYQGTQKIENGTLTTTDLSEEDIKTRYKVPMDMSVGSRWNLGSMTLLADVSYQLGSDFNALESANFPAHIRTDSTFRFNTGALFKTSDKFEMGVGFMFNPSSIHDLDNRDEGDSRSNYIGFTLGFYWMPDNVRTGLSIFHLRGSGELIPILDPTQRATLGSTATGAGLTISYLL